jgi:CRP-like cAMP-binding protein
MAQSKAPRDLVRDFPFFKGLDEETYAELLAGGVTRSYAKGETLFHEGETCKGLFLVQSGVIKVYKLSEGGKEQILTLQRPGDSLAEVPVFDGGPYPASAAAMEDAIALAEAILAGLRNATLRQAAARENPRRMAEQENWRINACRMEEVYAAAIEHHAQLGRGRGRR